MKRVCLVLVALIAVPFAAPGNAPAADSRQVRARLYAPVVEGSSMGAGVVVTATLLDPALHVKAVARNKTNADGDLYTAFPVGVYILPGDTLRIAQPSYATVEHVVEKVALVALDPAADTVAGRISAGRAEAEIDTITDTLKDGAVQTYDITVGAKPDGSFSARLRSLKNIDLRRNDVVYLGYREGIFHVRLLCPVPGFRVTLNTNEINLRGLIGTSYVASLYGPGGVLKGTSRVTPLEGEGIEGFVSFNKPNGKPVRITSGDLITVRGAFGFSARVKRLEVVAVDTAGDVVTVRTIPNAGVYFRMIYFESNGDYRGEYMPVSLLVAGPDGLLTVACPVDIRPGDSVLLYVNDKAGNVLSTLHQVP
jgi:hypothetical protein